MTTKQAEQARETFELLQGGWSAAYDQFSEERRKQIRKYGETGYLVYANKGETERLDRLHRKTDRYADRMLRLLAALNPSVDWSTGIGIATMMDRLTYDQAVAGIKP